MPLKKTLRKIGTLNEKPLHESLKQWYAQPSDTFEISVDGFVVDIVHGNLLIEIQTRNFQAIRRKLGKLLERHQVRLVYPIPYEKWIIKQPDNEDGPVSRRKSPKRGAFIYVFDELISFPQLLMNPNFSLELLLIQEEEVRRYDGTHGWRRRGWVTHERRLLKVVDQRILKTPTDVNAFIPPELVGSFTTSDLANTLGKSRRFAQKMVYCLRLMGCITAVGKRANSILYARANT
ncbi:MAG: hypothetical protein JSV77_08010 [Dehalococcoidales bacterium]|nr:MAG: hypothetical protein JSV77_08010 [Dehalococcoidales bacterium]